MIFQMKHFININVNGWTYLVVLDRWSATSIMSTLHWKVGHVIGSAYIYRIGHAVTGNVSAMDRTVFDDVVRELRTMRLVAQWFVSDEKSEPST